MSRLLWNDRGTPDRKKGRDTMGFTGSFAPVTTLFAVQSHLDRSSIHLFAQTHPEVRALAVVSTGREVLQLLQNGLNPQVIVLDEPTAMLDPNGRKEVLRTVEELRKKEKVTVILITHYMEEVIDADKVFVMDHGHVKFDDAPRQVFHHYKELEEIGLAAPQVTYLMHEMKEKGMDVSTEATTVDEAKEAILRLIG